LLKGRVDLVVLAENLARGHPTPQYGDPLTAPVPAIPQATETGPALVQKNKSFQLVSYTSR